MNNNKELNLNSLVSRSENVVDSTIDDEVVMMSIEHGTYSGLDTVGSEIWRLIETPKRVSEICDALMTRFDVEEERCQKDVLAFLSDLASDDTITVCG